MICDSCEVVRINGILCHETGCPNAKKVNVVCKECDGITEDGNAFCSGHCYARYWGLYCDCDFCEEERFNESIIEDDSEEEE